MRSGMATLLLRRLAGTIRRLREAGTAGSGYSNFRSLLKLHVKGIYEALPLAPGARVLCRPAGSPNPWRKLLVKMARSPGVGSRWRRAR